MELQLLAQQLIHPHHYLQFERLIFQDASVTETVTDSPRGHSALECDQLTPAPWEGSQSCPPLAHPSLPVELSRHPPLPGQLPQPPPPLLEA